MTRLFAATAIATILATGAHAVTEAQEMSIKRYAPDANLTLYSDAELKSVLNIINSGDSRAEKASTVRALLRMTENSSPAMITEGERVKLSAYVADERIASMTTVEKDSVMNLIDEGGSRAEIQARVDGLLMIDPADFPGNDATQGEAALINFYAPEVDVSALTQEQLQSMLLVINSEESRGEIESKIEALITS